MPQSKREKSAQLQVEFYQRERHFTEQAEPAGVMEDVGAALRDTLSTHYNPFDEINPVAVTVINDSGLFKLEYRRGLYHIALLTVARRLNETLGSGEWRLQFERRTDVQAEMLSLLHDSAEMMKLREQAKSFAYQRVRHITQPLLQVFINHGIELCLQECGERAEDEERQRRELPERNAERRQARHLKRTAQLASIISAAKLGRKPGTKNPEKKFKSRDFIDKVKIIETKRLNGVPTFSEIAVAMRYPSRGKTSGDTLRQAVEGNMAQFQNKGYKAKTPGTLVKEIVFGDSKK